MKRKLMRVRRLIEQQVKREFILQGVRVNLTK